MVPMIVDFLRLRVCVLEFFLQTRTQGQRRDLFCIDKDSSYPEDLVASTDWGRWR